ncbi:MULTISPECIES: hypothetical protein [Tsukamurella]|uniref:hypothetical protein n=1 Tax=Tsukamurella TaxID=2060 RepID=UPI001CAA10B3|nr:MULTISPECIES: hypothetical protein [Tsukamurella]
MCRDLAAPGPRAVRHWLRLTDDEVAPHVLSLDDATRVEWSSLWPDRPDLRVIFTLEPGDGGSDVQWVLYAAEPLPGPQYTRHVARRVSTLVFADLRYTYGQ